MLDDRTTMLAHCGQFFDGNMLRSVKELSPEATRGFPQT
jgi:hypothetical protein